MSIIRQRCLCLVNNYPNGIISVVPKHLNNTKTRYFSYNTVSKNKQRNLLVPTQKLASIRQLGNGGIVESPHGTKVEIPNKSAIEFAYEKFEEYGDEPALTCAVSGRSYSYTMLRLLVNRCAQALLGHCGLKPGDVVGLILPNIPEFVIVCHGAIEAGLVVTTANPLYTPDEIKNQFQNAEVKMIVTIELFLDVALNIAPDLKNYKSTICVGAEDNPSKNVHGLQSLLMAGHTSDLPELDPKALCFMPFSSGTTGLPKGVMLSHNNLVTNSIQWSHPDILDKTAKDGRKHSALSILPLFHIFGFSSTTTSVRQGGHFITIPRFVPEDYLKALLEYRPTYLLLVPPLLSFLASSPDVTADHLASVEGIQSGAVMLKDGILKQFKEKFKTVDILIRQGYGMTETSPVTITMPINAPETKRGSIGTVVPGTQAKIISLSTSEVLGPNESGELLIKGPQVMMGYLNNEKATKETIDEDGWLHTGDVAYYDDDYYFYIVDRCKELIKVKGFQVSPSELEGHLIQIEGVADAAVVGIPDEVSGEVPRAFVVKAAGSNITEQDIQRIVDSKVSKHKKLDGGIKFIDSIPRNLAGKILRNELQSL